MNEIEKSSDNNILKKYEDLTPINLVDTMERYYHTFLPKQNTDSFNILTTYKSKNNVKFRLLDFEYQKKLSPLLLPKIKNIQTMKIYGDYFFLSDTSGSVYMYSVSRQAEIKVMTPPGKIDYFATSIDVSPNAEFVIVGYSNGFLILWDTKKPSIIHTIKELHKAKIIFGQFSQILEKKKFEIISSDMSGKLVKSFFTNSLFKKSVQEKVIYEDNVPTYAITQFRPLRNKQVILGAFCNVHKIRVYILRPVFVSFFEIERPDCYDEYCLDIPDISFGWGCEPLENDNDNTMMKLDDIQRQNQILLAVSWGQVIRIYSMNLKDEDMILNGDGAKCHFINNCAVVRLGFISPSIIYFFDKNAEIKIINTAYTQYGDYHQEKKGEFIYNKKALVEEGKIIDKNLLKINISNEPYKQLLCYRYFINNMSKCIYLCTENGFYLGKVLNFEDCILNVVKEDWLGALSLTIDIHQGNISSFPDIPLIRSQRIKLLKPFITSLLEKYINDNLPDNNKPVDEKDLIKCINVVIEFCIGIKEIEFLFKNGENSFRKKGKNDLFYKLLEPFIFNDLLINELISEDSLISLYTSYKSSKSLTILQHLFTHLNYICLNTSTIKKIAFKENLFTLMILIFSNCKGYQNFFLPIAKMYKVFEEKIKEKENYEFKSYVDTFGNDDIKGINLMEESTEYIGHKLLWYIDMSLKGKKFSLGMDVNLLKFDKESKDYEYFVALIYFWIVQENIFLNLIKFDSYSFLNILSLFYSDSTLLNIIKSFDFNQFSESMISKLSDEKEIKFLKDIKAQPPIDSTNPSVPSIESDNAPKKQTLDYNNILAVINHIIQITQNISDFFINIDLSIFIIKFAFRYSEKTPLPAAFKKKVTESFKKCLTFYDEYNKLKETSPNEVKDIFNCHKVNKLSEIKTKNFFFNEIYRALRDLIDSNYKWKKDDLNSIIEIGKNSPYTLVIIRLYEYIKNFGEVLNCYLNTDNNIEFQSEDVFAWLQRMFQSFSRKNEDLNEVDFKNLQQTVVDNVSKLAKLSLTKTNKIIKQFYTNDQKIIIIHKLDDAPLLQYEFIKQLLTPTRGGGGRLEEVKSEDKNSESDENDSSKNTKNESLSNILLMEIELLIKLEKYKEVLPSVKEKLSLYPNAYPKEKSLQKCLENNINDAAVLLYQSLGQIDKAIELTKNSVEKAFEDYMKEKGDEKYQKFIEELNLRIKICEDTSEFIEKNNIFNDENINDDKVKISQKEIEDIWFNVLYQLYDFEKKGTSDENIVKNIKENINQLLRKMCLHVKLRNIIEVVINKREDSPFKDFQNILCEMIQSNNNFNRILTNTMIIMKNCAITSEEEMLQECVKGNCYNNEKCDVCQKLKDDKKNEKIFCFGCGHQCHEFCAFNKNDEYESECPICKEKEIIDEPILKFNKDKIINNNIIDEKDKNEINNEENKIKKDKRNFENKDDNIKKLNNFDEGYFAMLEEI